jgi:hypothetical protein
MAHRFPENFISALESWYELTSEHHCLEALIGSAHIHLVIFKLGHFGRIYNIFLTSGRKIDKIIRNFGLAELQNWEGL